MCVCVCVCVFVYCFKAYLQELGELQVVESFLAVMAEVQVDELTLPVERDVMVHRCLAKDVAHIVYTYRGKSTLSEMDTIQQSALFCSWCLILMTTHERERKRKGV